MHDERRPSLWRWALPIVAIGILAVLTLAPRWFSGGRPAIFADLSLHEARERALTQDRLLVIDYWASWCPPCLAMDQGAWADPAVAAWVRDNAVAVQIDIDAHGDLAAAARVTAIPLIVVERNGEVVERLSGLQAPAELLESLRRLR